MSAYTALYMHQGRKCLVPTGPHKICLLTSVHCTKFGHAPFRYTLHNCLHTSTHYTQHTQHTASEMTHPPHWQSGCIGHAARGLGCSLNTRRLEEELALERMDWPLVLHFLRGLGVLYLVPQLQHCHLSSSREKQLLVKVVTVVEPAFEDLFVCPWLLGVKLKYKHLWCCV